MAAVTGRNLRVVIYNPQTGEETEITDLVLPLKMEPLPTWCDTSRWYLRRPEVDPYEQYRATGDCWEGRPKPPH